MSDGDDTRPTPAQQPAWPPPAAPTPVIPPPGPTAGAPAGGGWAPPPPAKRKLTWLWVVLAALAVLLASGTIVIVWFLHTIRGPIDATNLVLRDWRRGDYATAYADSCPKTRASFKLAEFTQDLQYLEKTNGRLVSFDVNYTTIHGARATVKFDLNYEHESTRKSANAYKQGGRWRVCLFERR